MKILRVVLLSSGARGVALETPVHEYGHMTLDMIVTEMSLPYRSMQWAVGTIEFEARGVVYKANFDPSTMKSRTMGVPYTEWDAPNLPVAVVDDLILQHGRPALEKVHVVVKIEPPDDRSPTEIVAEADARWSAVERELLS